MSLWQAWQREQMCFLFVVDCQPLSKVACGMAPLFADDLRPAFTQICDNMGSVLSLGWLPERSWADPIEWRRRSRNIRADFMANVTTDRARSWCESLEWPFPGRTLKQCHVVAHSDGGTRRYNCSATGWTLDEVARLDGNWVQRPLAMGGTYIDVAILRLLHKR